MDCRVPGAGRLRSAPRCAGLSTLSPRRSALGRCQASFEGVQPRDVNARVSFGGAVPPLVDANCNLEVQTFFDHDLRTEENCPPLMEVGPRTPRREPLDLLGQRRAFVAASTVIATRVPRGDSPALVTETRRPLRKHQFTRQLRSSLINERSTRRTTPIHGARCARELSGVSRRTRNCWSFSTRPRARHRVEQSGFAHVLLGLRCRPMAACSTPRARRKAADASVWEGLVGLGGRRSYG